MRDLIRRMERAAADLPGSFYQTRSGVASQTLGLGQCLSADTLERLGCLSLLFCDEDPRKSSTAKGGYARKIVRRWRKAAQRKSARVNERVPLGLEGRYDDLRC